MRRIHKYDWFDRVALWRGSAPGSLNRQVIGASERSAYYFNLNRFCHKVVCETLSQMTYAEPRSIESAT